MDYPILSDEEKNILTPEEQTLLQNLRLVTSKRGLRVVVTENELIFYRQKQEIFREPRSYLNDLKKGIKIEPS